MQKVQNVGILSVKTSNRSCDWRLCSRLESSETSLRWTCYEQEPGMLGRGIHFSDSMLTAIHVCLTRFRLQSTLNKFMGLGSEAWAETRSRLQELLGVNCNELKGNNSLKDKYDTL